MASRRTSSAPSSFKNTSTDAKSSKGVSNGVKANNNPTTRKTVKTSGTVVKSRYLQSAEKTSLSKSNSLTNESTSVLRPSSPKPTSVKPKAVTPTRRSMTPQTLAESTFSRETESSLLGKSVLQSTFTDGHAFRPDFDISVIKEKTVIENSKDAERNPENNKRIIEMQTFLLAYLTAKMENNTAKFKAEAEAKLLQIMTEEQRLHSSVNEKKSQYLLMEKKKQLHEILDLQIDKLTPVADAANQFTKDYKSFAAAVDTTRHELPVKNFYINGNGREFLDKAEASLKQTETLLQECTRGDHVDNSTSLECLREMKTMSKDISQQLTGTCSELLELSSLVCRHSVQVQQAVEEEQLGSSRTLQLFCPRD
ncbi:HAUS augmin-like complex subunit 8 [Cyprinodon tularosa]|uniref:HAUS augmin-like complex subunit 8 n=1 Tax=Cyprinodon tularosa TaxID=77115 RepID=UPI0018E26FFB|nr:HAUS augmin-like complex subunit 8 [Cyprinodon tularosa]